MGKGSESLSVEDVMSVGMVSDSRGRIVAPAVRDLAEAERALAGWLGSRLPQARDLRLTDLSYPRGSGQSHETILFDVHWREDGVERCEGLVVRIKPTSFMLFHDDMFLEEFQLMRVLGESGVVPIAKVRWLEEDPSVLGAPFFVMDKVAGRVAVSMPSYLDAGWVAEATPEQRATLWDSAIRALASVQKVSVDDVPFLNLPSGGTGFAQEWERWERFLRPVDRPDRPLPVYRKLLELLRETIPSNRPEGITWGDARLGNMMIGDDFRVVALMDWEQPSLGGALQDLGWWLISHRGKLDARGGESLPGVLARDDTIRLWGDITGISPEGIDWYEAFAAYKMAVCMVRMLDLRGQVPPGGDYEGMFHVRAARELLGA